VTWAHQPVFPINEHRNEYGLVQSAHSGLQLREYFAIKIMAALASDPECAVNIDVPTGSTVANVCADTAVEWTEALIARLNRGT
jgi:hypothetical protein